jgi:hypothetical protein
VKVGRRHPGLLGTVLPAILTAAAGITVIAVSASTTPATRTAAFDPHAPVAHLDTFAMRMGGMRIAGWAYDPDALTTPLIITANVDHKQAAATTANLARPDFAKQYPKAGPDHGFDFFVPVPEGNHLVCTWAVNVGAGTNYKIGCTQQVFSYGPIGSLDSVNLTPGHISVRGWAIDRDTPKQPVTVVVKTDNSSQTLIADQPRPDVGSSHPAAGPNHGFSVRYAVSQGTHTVCVTAKNIGYGSDTNLGCKTVVIDDDPVGALETVAQQSGKLHVVGWTFDHDAPTTPLTVTVKVDSTSHAVVANVARSDVASAHPLAGPNHGFDLSYQLPEGNHTVCVTVQNIGYGKNATFPCRTGTLNFTPTAALSSLAATATGVRVTGWASDPDTTAPISVNLSVDGKAVTTIKASGTGGSHSGHNFAANITLKSGAHKVCAVGLNVLYGTHNSTPACQSITLALNPLGGFDALNRASGSANLAVTGWAFDPDTSAPISVRITLDGKTYATVAANQLRTDIASKYPGYGSDHGLATVVTTNAGEHTVCLTALNVSGGANLDLGCKLIIAVHPVAPSAVQKVSALAGYGGATVTWSPPASDGGAPWSGYTVVSNPGGISVTAGASATSATVLGLQPNTSYTFSVTAKNVAGTSPASVSASVTTQASPPNQTTPAPVSTSRYIRNISDGSASAQTTMRSEGATDAFYNPSGHGYLILLDIGGQDQYDGGVVLSATTRFVSYGDLVTDLKAYVDGYHSKQNPSAPITIAIGTNNDMDVTSASGKAWATQVVNPVASYAKKYTGITIAGANDIEPGFRASYAATKSWLSGYLAATTAPFVFNGSADGCSWTTTGRGCNNGWTMSGLYYLAAGAAPIRMLNLPQIYNTTMAAQWKYISLTGVTAGQPRIDFGGTLTEWTACDQTNSCGSLTGHTAWSTLWNNLQSDVRLKVASLPYSTDLRIDK